MTITDKNQKVICVHRKQNVLGKLVIPKIQKAIAYIKSELEEQEREETFRLKIFKRSKDKKQNAAKKLLAKPEEKPCLQIDTTCLHEPDILEFEPICGKKKEECVCCSSPPHELDEQCGIFVCPICKLADKNIAINVVPCKLCLPEVTEAKHRLSHLMAHVNQVLLLSRQYNQSQDALEKGKQTNEGQLCYTNVKQQLDYISYSTCICPHTATNPETKPKPAEPDLTRDDSCTCLDPCVCDETSSQEESNNNTINFDLNEPRFQTYNLCSIYGSSSFPQSSVNCRSFFKNTAKSYPPMPPFFYLYSGPYVYSETGMHPIQSKTANTYLVDAPCADELKQTKACPCKEIEIKKSCTCNTVSPQRLSKGLCTCDSTEILIPLVDQLPYHVTPLRHSEGLKCKDICTTNQPVASLHSPNRPTDLAKRITRLSEPCLKNKYSNDSCGPVCGRVDPKNSTKFHSHVNAKPYDDLQIASHPINKIAMDQNIDTSSTKRLANHELREYKSWNCESISTQQSLLDLCACDSTRTLKPSEVQISRSPSSLQSKATSLIFYEMMCKFSQPVASLPSSSQPIELTRQIPKASESYFKTNCLRNAADAICDIEAKMLVNSEGNLTKSSNRSCSCESLEHKKSCSCKSGQSCSCASLSSNTTKDISSSDKLFSNNTDSPYFKKSTTFYTAIPQRLTSCNKEEQIVPPKFYKVTDVCSTTVFNESAKQYLYIDPCVIPETDSESYHISNTSSITDFHNKFISVQATYLLPYTREGKPGPCGISGMNFVTYSIDNTIYSPYTIQDATLSSNFLPSYKRVLCGAPQINQARNSLDNSDLQSTSVGSYTREHTIGCSTTSNTSSITNDLDGMDSSQCMSLSKIDIFSEEAKFSGTPKKFKKSNGAISKDFSIYVTLNPQVNSPYKAYAQQGRPSPCSNCETAYKTDGSSKLRDCCTYVTVIRKRPVPYTREGRPGPCGISEADHKTHYVISEDFATFVTTISKRNNKSKPTDDDEHIYLSTQEDTPGPYNICRTCTLEEPYMTPVNKIIMCSTCNLDLGQPARDAPYTREDKIGPCGVTKVLYTGRSQDNLNCCQSRKMDSYTREGLAGPSGVCETKKSHNIVCSEPYTRKGIPGQCNTSETVTDILCNAILKPYTHVAPYTRERTPGPCGVTESKRIAGPVCIRRPKLSSGVRECTQKDKPSCISKQNRKTDFHGKSTIKPLYNNDPKGILEHCDVSESNHVLGSHSSKLNSNCERHTRKGILESCCESEINRKSISHYNTTQLTSNAPPYTREGLPGLNREFIYSSKPKSSTDIEPYTREGIRGPWCISQTNYIADYRRNTSFQTLLGVRPNTREGVPGPSGVIETSNIVASVCEKASKLPEDVRLQNQEELPGSCGASKIKNNIVGFFCNMALKPLLENGSYIREGTPGPCGFVETNHISGFPSNTDTKPYLDNKPYNCECPSEHCGISKKDHESDLLHNTGINPLSHIVPYTREGMPGPCGIAANSYEARTNITEEKVKYVEPYTRENRPGPTGIADSDLNNCSQQHTPLLPYCTPDSQLKAWNFYELTNIKDSKILKKGVSRLCHLEPYRHVPRGPCGIKDFTFCDTQSCMMCQVFTPPYNREALANHIVNHNTKDAVTFVTLIPRLVPCSRERVPKCCGTCDRKNANNTAVSDNTSGNCCKTRAPHIRINETRSLDSTTPMDYTFCKHPRTASTASSIILPTYRLSMSRSTILSAPCSCKSCMPSTATLGCGTTCYQSVRSVNPKKCCSICGRPSSKKDIRKVSNSNLISSNQANCYTFASNDLPKSQPCTGCGKTKLVLTCASNPSVKSIAIGTCVTPCALKLPIPKISMKSPCGKSTKVCSVCSESNDSKKSDSHESDSSSEIGTLASYPNNASEELSKKKKQRKHMGESEFGYFETGYKIITKLCKYKNPDGTITDEKRTITIKTKKKCPQKVQDTKLEMGTTISRPAENETNSKTHGNFQCKSCRKSKSDVVQNNIYDLGASPKIRTCISAQDHQVLKESLSIFKTCLGANCTSSQKSLPSKFACDNQLVPKLKGPMCDNGPTCDCGMKTYQKPIGSECHDKLHDSESTPKYGSASKSLCKPPSPKKLCGAEDSYNDSSSEGASKLRHTSIGPLCAKKPHDKTVQPKCVCTNNNTATRTDLICGNKIQDRDSDPTGKFKNKCCSKPSSQISNIRSQDKEPKPSCKCKQTQANDSGSKYDLSGSLPELICPGCVKKPIDTKPKGDDKRNLFVPAGKVYDYATIRNSSPLDAKSKLICNPINKTSPIPDICANRLQDSGNNPIRTCAQKSSSKKSVPELTDVVCANRLHDSNSGPKCDCAEKSALKSANTEIFHSEPTDLTCANRLQDSDSGPKCDCAAKTTPKSTDVVCGKRLQNLDNRLKRNCVEKSPHKATEPLCANRLQDTDSGEKCDCVEQSLPEPTFPIQDLNSSECSCISECYSKPGQVFTNKILNSGCDQTSVASKLLPKLTAPSFANTTRKCSGLEDNIIYLALTGDLSTNKQMDSISNPNSERVSKSLPELTSSCDNYPQDADRMSDCENTINYFSKMNLSCTNTQNIINNDSKCECFRKLLPISDILVHNKLLQSISLPELITPICKSCNPDTETKPKDNDGNAIFVMPNGTECSNKDQNVDSNSKPQAPVCDNKLPDTNSCSNCHCPKNNKINIPLKHEYSTCAVMLQDPDSDPTRNFSNKLPSDFSNPMCANRTLDSYSGPKCDCGSKTLPKSTTAICANRLEDTESGPKFDCPNEFPPKSYDPTCANRLQNIHNSPKCHCKNIFHKSTEPVYTDQRQNRPRGDYNTASLVADNNTGTVIDFVNGPPSINPKAEADNLQQKVVDEEALKLHDVLKSCNCKKKKHSTDHQIKKVGYSAQEEGRVIDLHEIKNCGKVMNINDQNKVPCCGNKSTSITLPQNNDLRIQGDTGTVIDFNDFKEKSENILPYTIPEHKDLYCSIQEESGTVLELHKTKGSCSCATRFQNKYFDGQKEVYSDGNESHLINTDNKAMDGFLQRGGDTQNGIVWSPLEESEKVLDSNDVKENCYCYEKKLPSTRSENINVSNLSTKEVIQSLYGGTGMVLHLNKVKETCNCANAIEHHDIAVSTTDLCFPETNEIDPSNNCCSVKMIPKAHRSSYCGALDAKKPSLFKGGSMIDALRQLFQHSNNSRTLHPKILTGKNICSPCYSPPSNRTESESFTTNSYLCQSCKEKLIDKKEQHYRCTVYNTEPESTLSKGVLSPLCQNFCFLKAGVDNKKTSLDPTTTISHKTDDCIESISSDDKLTAIKNSLRYTDAATLPRQRDFSMFIRVMKKGKIEHCCPKCGTKDGPSHSKHK